MEWQSYDYRHGLMRSSGHVTALFFFAPLWPLLRLPWCFAHVCVVWVNKTRATSLLWLLRLLLLNFWKTWPIWWMFIGHSYLSDQLNEFLLILQRFVVSWTEINLHNSQFQTCTRSITGVLLIYPRLGHANPLKTVLRLDGSDCVVNPDRIWYQHVNLLHAYVCLACIKW